MKRFFLSLFKTIMTVVLALAIIFLVIIVYNNLVEEDKAIDLSKISSFFNEKIMGVSENDPFDIIDEPVINQELETNYFYSQLDENGKIIYTALDSNKENMKSGTYKIELGTVFANTLKTEDGEDVLGDSYQSAIEAFIYDNPDVFYLDVNNMYLNIQKTTKGEKVRYEVYIDNGTNVNYLSDGFETKEQIEECENEIEEVTSKILSNVTGNDYQKILKIHDYLVENINYDRTVQKENIYNIYGALVKKECVCEGYAKSLKYLANKAGINCVIVAGTAANSSGENESHAWNYILLNNTWYAIDVTWDDPIIIGSGTLSNSSKYKYFLKGSNTMSKDHQANGQFTSDGKIFTYPTLSQSDYR